MRWAWVDSNHRPHAYQALKLGSESRQDAGRHRWIVRSAAFAILRCRELPGSVDRTTDRTLATGRLPIDRHVISSAPPRWGTGRLLHRERPVRVAEPCARRRRPCPRSDSGCVRPSRPVRWDCIHPRRGPERAGLDRRGRLVTQRRYHRTIAPDLPANSKTIGHVTRVGNAVVDRDRAPRDTGFGLIDVIVTVAAGSEACTVKERSELSRNGLNPAGPCRPAEGCIVMHNQGAAARSGGRSRWYLCVTASSCSVRPPDGSSSGASGCVPPQSDRRVG